MVAPRREAIEELLTDGVHALLVPPGDGQALSEAIGRLVGSGELRKAIARAGAELASREMGWDHQLVRVERLIQSLSSR